MTAMAEAGCSRETMALVEEIYKKATAVARDSDVPIDIARGCLQGCVLSPLLFCLVLALVLKGVNMDPLLVDGLEVDYLAYADDIGTTCNTAAGASATAQGIADASRVGADLHINVGKTESTKIAPKAKLANTTSEDVAGLDLDINCEYCNKAFFTEAGLRLHKREHCQQARVPTWERTFDIDSIIDVRGAPDRRWYRVAWHGDNDYSKVVQGVRPGQQWTPTWEPAAHLQHNAGEDGELFIDKYWRVHPTAKGRDRARANEVPGEHRCKNCNFISVSEHGLKIHKARAKKSGKCKAASDFMSKQAERTVRRGKHKKLAAEDGDKVYIDGKPLVNVLSFKYLGSYQEQDATTDHAIRVRLAQGRARFNQMYHIWIDKNLTVDSKVRMYKTSIAMIARHGSEAWDLTPANLKMIRAWNTGCLATITGRPHHEEGNEYTTTFDFGGDIRLKRLQWLGALLRLPEHRMVHKAVRARHDSKSLPPGSILMDAPATATFAELVARADDKCSWQKLCSDTFPQLYANEQQQLQRQQLRRHRLHRQTRLRPRQPATAPTTVGGPAPTAAPGLNPSAHSFVQQGDGLVVTGPDTSTGAAVDPSEYRLTYGNWCHFVPGVGWTSSKH